MDRSLKVVGGDLWSHLNSRGERIERASRLFNAIRSGLLRPPRIERFHLDRGAEAHRRMEDRNFFGKIVMTSSE
jgi:NADPH2:quinone reductase